ncbi:hypothetical protein QTP70_001488 [Hemibagrus guttatus]|uniref:Uncharacterized protein n=1 Tax=Hemibagrus guttatus TaxID=175788 RepID=A0AAE0QDL4_9TELE|nr:hypothetical protein QTP70_001488 [Hemibagrus guttatus]KAK3546871.1 hypothetical protein QTP86_003799 [Hemibagrus guttatus]
MTLGTLFGGGHFPFYRTLWKYGSDILPTRDTTPLRGPVEDTTRQPGWKMLPPPARPLKLHQVGWGSSVHSHFQISPETFNRVKVWALAGPLKDIHRVVL